MTLLPRHPASRIAAALWLLACATCLLLTLLQPNLHDNDRAALTYLVPVYFLGFPATHMGFVAIAKIKLFLYLNGGVEPSLLSECLYLWTSMVVLGYVQWFIALPWLSRLSWRLCDALFNRSGECRQ